MELEGISTKDVYTPEALKSLYRSPGNKKNNWSYVKTMSCVILELRST